MNSQNPASSTTISQQLLAVSREDAGGTSNTNADNHTAGTTVTSMTSFRG